MVWLFFVGIMLLWFGCEVEYFWYENKYLFIVGVVLGEVGWILYLFVMVGRELCWCFDINGVVIVGIWNGVFGFLFVG